MAEPIRHVCKRGDHIFRIAKEYGVTDWETVWNHPDNAELKKTRTPHMLYVGDIVVVPIGDAKEESGATQKHHPFKAKKKKLFLRLRILDESGTPLAKAQFSIKFDVAPTPRKGTTDKDGMIEVKGVDPAAQSATLTVRVPSQSRDGAIVGEMPVTWTLGVGKLHPILQPAPTEECIPGVKQRLSNLGFDCALITEGLNDVTRNSIRAFCAAYGISARDHPDAELRRKLHEAHDKPKNPALPVKGKK